MKESFMERCFWWIANAAAILMVIILKMFFNMEWSEALIWVAIRYAILYILFIATIVSILFWGITITGLKLREKVVALTVNISLLFVPVFAFFWIYWMTTPNAMIASGIVTVASIITVSILIKRFEPYPENVGIQYARLG